MTPREEASVLLDQELLDRLKWVLGSSARLGHEQAQRFILDTIQPVFDGLSQKREQAQGEMVNLARDVLAAEQERDEALRKRDQLQEFFNVAVRTLEQRNHDLLVPREEARARLSASGRGGGWKWSQVEDIMADLQPLFDRVARERDKLDRESNSWMADFGMAVQRYETAEAERDDLRAKLTQSAKCDQCGCAYAICPECGFEAVQRTAPEGEP